MSYRRFTRTVIVFLVLMLLFVAGVVFVIDPFCQYHMPWFGMEAVYDRGTQSYTNPGLAKNYEYDSVLLGSSVSENFRASWFDELFDCNTLKLPYAGAWSKTYTQIMQVVFEEKTLKNVFFSVDQFAFQNDASVLRYEMPLYLYDRNPLNDVNYLLNKEVFSEIYDMYQYNHSGKIIPYDDAYSWQETHVFSEERVLKQYKRPQKASAERNADYWISAAEKNLNNILPFVEDNPDTTFYFFFPPYSILWWDMYERTSSLDAILNMTGYIMERLLEYENVRVFYFQNQPEIILDLNNYRESMHFSRDINHWEAKCLASGEYEVLAGEVQQILEGMKSTTLSFDYDASYGAQ